STPPRADRARLAARAQVSSSATSPWTAKAAAPSARNWPAASSTSLARSTRTSRAPSAASRAAVARPMSEAPPVTIAVLPAKRPAVAAGAGSGMRVILFGRRCCSAGRAAGGRAGAVAASPLGDGAVGVPPDGVAPPVPFAGPLADVVLVDLDAEARPGGDGDVPSGVGERAGFREV